MNKNVWRITLLVFGVFLAFLFISLFAEREVDSVVDNKAIAINDKKVANRFIENLEKFDKHLIDIGFVRKKAGKRYELIQKIHDPENYYVKANLYIIQKDKRITFKIKYDLCITWLYSFFTRKTDIENIGLRLFYDELEYKIDEAIDSAVGA